MSAVAVDLLKRLLQRDPDKRLGGGPLDAEEIKVSPAGLSLLAFCVTDVDGAKTPVQRAAGRAARAGDAVLGCGCYH